MEQNVIKIENADIFQYNKHLVLTDVSLHINKGEFVYLIGETGSGKSSLLKILYADLELTNGDAWIGGVNLRTLKKKDVPYLRRKLGIVFQDFQLLTDRTIEENLLFVLRATGWTDKKIMSARIDEVLQNVGLVHKRHKWPHEISGGEQQRVVIARALLNHPEVILADEPTGNLDPKTSSEILNLLKSISKLGTAVLMATHDYRIIERFPSRIVKCENGKVYENATVPGN
ncbi:cell division transport system ATP-binding protein [Anseongella ginsenosidimutans]|uniref:Cell division ATP-binding protein FtsE n=1 Tax=Anseongella ginsenosidimutans TaxID=496056 RepID=A0A4R3KRK0_9SPHI|nr:ATP-binding cassette domain-containing protein [Anseongella ginsenosidimutans]QEC52960.1 ATP-binding cassette domain-containing protein [Anseongella ginsenosidimutans]TCS87361.1 cell division transport system ATP-binding protein [Anseongella ginsenosidimutans]